MSNQTTPPSETPLGRRIFANRTLNLRSIQAIGYDMDYTLVHYRVRTWEERAYARLQELLGTDGWPVGHLRFDPDLVIRGLIVDSELGNLVKANRFGYVMRAAHGTRMMDFVEQRDVYRHTPVELSDPRFIFLNTLFSLSETCLYSQLVDLLDEGRLPGVNGYEDLFRKVRARMDETHVEGTLKAEITADPARFIDLDPDAAPALLDQKRAGKRLMLISNAEWEYARDIMTFAFDPFLGPGETWRDLFELVIVGARKPGILQSKAADLPGRRRGQGPLGAGPGSDSEPGHLSRRRRRQDRGIPRPFGLTDPLCRRSRLRRCPDVQGESPLEDGADPARTRRGTPRHRGDQRCRGGALTIDGRKRGSRTTPLLGAGSNSSAARSTTASRAPVRPLRFKPTSKTCGRGWRGSTNRWDRWQNRPPRPSAHDGEPRCARDTTSAISRARSSGPPTSTRRGCRISSSPLRSPISGRNGDRCRTTRG